MNNTIDSLFQLWENAPMNYNFFDYKYNIEGYHGQHFGSIYQTIFLVGCLLICFILAFTLRKVKKETIDKALGYIGVFMTILYIVKTIWESHYDVQRDGFNTYLLPFDTCSILMWATLIAGFCKGYFADWAKKWLCTLGFVGGFANALFLNALKYYPFFSFGAFYSMLWHGMMIFLAWWLLFSGNVKITLMDIPRSFGFHAVFSVVPILINHYVSQMNWMLYGDAGGIPFIEDIVKPYANTWTGTFMVLLTYLAVDAFLVVVYMSVERCIVLVKNKNTVKA